MALSWKSSELRGKIIRLYSNIHVYELFNLYNTIKSIGVEKWNKESYSDTVNIKEIHIYDHMYIKLIFMTCAEMRFWHWYAFKWMKQTPEQKVQVGK